MREIVTMEQAEHLFLLLAIAGPIVGAALGAIAGARKGRTGPAALKGLSIGLLGVLNLILWKVYNAITDHLGLDTVKNLVVNLVLFVGLGAAAGIAFGYASRLRVGFVSGGGEPGSGPAEDGGAPVHAAPSAPRAGSGAARRVEESEEPPREP